MIATASVFCVKTLDGSDMQTHLSTGGAVISVYQEFISKIKQSKPFFNPQNFT